MTDAIASLAVECRDELRTTLHGYHYDDLLGPSVGLEFAATLLRGAGRLLRCPLSAFL